MIQTERAPRGGARRAAGRGAWQQGTPGPAALFMAKISLKVPPQRPACVPLILASGVGVFLLCKGCRGQRKQLALDVLGVLLQLHHPTVMSGFIMQQVVWEENGKHEP